MRWMRGFLSGLWLGYAGCLALCSGCADTRASEADTGTRIVDGSAGALDASSSVSNDAATTMTGCASGPLDTPIPGCRPRPVPDTGDLRDDCVARINQFRWECQCLPPLTRWNAGEACADQQAEYDVTHGPHAGIRAMICSPGGGGQNECPGWGSSEDVLDGCMQAMWDEGPGEDFQAHGHYLNMSNTAYTGVACGFHTTANGRVWAVQNFIR